MKKNKTYKFMRIFRYGFISVAFWIAKYAHQLNNKRVAKNRFIRETVKSPDVEMLTNETPNEVMNDVWGVAEEVASTSSGGFGMMKSMLIRATGIPMLTKTTDDSVYSNIYELGRTHYSAYRGRPIWRTVFVKAVIASHLIPCIGEETAGDILDTICAIVEHTVPPEIAARELFSKLLASHIDIPMINQKTEKVVFESLYNIAMSAVFNR